MAGLIASCEAVMPHVYFHHSQPWGAVALGVLIGIPVLIVLTALVLWIKYRIDYRE